LRAELLAGRNVSPYMPAAAHELLRRDMEAGAVSDGLAGMERHILYTLRTADRAMVRRTVDSGGGLIERILDAAAHAGTLAELYERAKPRRYTLARVRRAVLAAVLGIDETYHRGVPYLRILAIGDRGEELLSAMSGKTAVPLTHSLKKLASDHGEVGRMARMELRASELYALCLRKPIPSLSEYTEKTAVIRENHADM